jgi:hypothetical protein
MYGNAGTAARWAPPSSADQTALFLVYYLIQVTISRSENERGKRNTGAFEKVNIGFWHPTQAQIYVT